MEDAMRGSLLVALFGAGLSLAVLAATSWSEPADGQPRTAAVAGQESGIITHLAGADGQPLLLTVVDAKEHWLGVYQIDRQSGAITLKSTRSFTWDRQLKEFNSDKPSPQDIRSGLPR
jgi:hypothetical protein